MDIKFITYENTKSGLHTLHSFNRAMEIELANVLPGQPLLIHWRYRRFRDPWALDWSRRWTGMVNARFYVEGKLVHEHNDIAVTDALDGTGRQTENIIISDRNFANIVYRVGRKWLEIEIVRRDKAATPYRWAHLFWVIPEAFDGSWWEWRARNAAAVPWKSAYVLIGDFVNKSRYAAMSTLSCELSEVRSEDNPLVNPCDYEAIQIASRNGIAPLGTMPIAFNLMHDWSWITPAAYVVYGPLQKSFTYAVWFRCDDEYGNVYRGACSPHAWRRIEISGAKRSAGGVATGAAASAAALAIAGAAALAGIITAIGAPFLFAAAAVAYGLAASSGEIAKDPPAPDPEFRQPVEVVPLRVAKLMDKPEAFGTELSVVLRVLEIAAHILALENARTVTRARMMGAALFGDRQARETHQQGYLRIEAKMTEEADRLQNLLPDVEKLIEPGGPFDSKSMNAWSAAMTTTGFNHRMIEAMKEAGLDAELRSGLAALGTQEWIMELAGEKGLFLLVLFIENLHDFVQSVGVEREGILAGETYVEPPQLSAAASPPPADLEARPRPRGEKCC